MCWVDLGMVAASIRRPPGLCSLIYGGGQVDVSVEIEFDSPAELGDYRRGISSYVESEGFPDNYSANVQALLTLELERRLQGQVRLRDSQGLQCLKQRAIKCNATELRSHKPVHMYGMWRQGVDLTQLPAVGAGFERVPRVSHCSLSLLLAVMAALDRHQTYACTLRRCCAMTGPLRTCFPLPALPPTRCPSYSSNCPASGRRSLTSAPMLVSCTW